MFSLVIVDDEKEIRNGLMQYFPWQDLCITVTASFENGLTALEYLKFHPVDILLTDILMPVMDGLALIKQAKVLKPKLVAVVLSGYRDFDYAQRAMTLGVTEYLVKPTRYEELQDVFSRIVNHLAHGIDFEKVSEPQLVQDMKLFIDNNLSNVTLDSLSNAVALNTYYVSTLFHQLTGETFSDYVNKKRMKKAGELLSTTRLSIQEIGLSIGYENSSSFGRSFKLFYHMSPRDYREQKR